MTRWPGGWFWRWRYRTISRLRRVRPLPPEPYGTLMIGTARFRVDRLTLQGGCVEVTGQAMNPFPGGMKGAGWPTTYRLLGEDGRLVKVGKLDASPFTGLITTMAMSLRLTVRIQLPLTGDLVNETCSDCGGNRIHDHYRVCGLGPGAFGPTARSPVSE